jgi:hypothetical protein
MKKKPDTHKVHKEIKGFDIKVNKFGELNSNIKIDEINAFLNKHIHDKRVKDEPVLNSPSQEEE